MLSFNKKLFATALSFLAFSQAANADVFNYEDLTANNGGMADVLESVSASFNDVTDEFTWNAEFNSTTSGVDGFWLVVNNGPNPKSSNVNELAIMYGDLNSNTLTTYVYNGANNANSWSTPGIFLQTDSLTSDSDSLSLSIDATAINAWSTDPDYTGISFDDQIGIWFHVSTNSSFSYLNDQLTGYSFGSQGWYDLSNQSTTTSAPEPFSLTLFSLALLGLGFNRRNKRT